MPLTPADLSQITALIQSQLNQARVKISNLPEVGPGFTNVGVFPFVDNGSTQKIPLSKILGRSFTTVAIGQDLRAMDSDTLTDGQMFYITGVLTPNDGGEGFWIYDEDSVASDNIGTVIQPDDGVGRFLRQYSGPINMLWFGTPDRTAVASAFDVGGEIDFPAGTWDIGSTGVTVTSSVTKITMDPAALILYSGTSAAVTLDNIERSGAEYYLRVKKTVADWDPGTGTGTDTTSVGVLMDDCTFTKLRLMLAENFATGLKMFSDGTGIGGTQFCDVQIVNITDCKVGVQTKKDGSGFVNNNQIRGGQIRINGSQTQQLAGTKYIDIEDGNGNTFDSICIQNDSAEYSLYVNDNANLFLNLRYEGNQQDAITFTSNAAYNLLLGGVFNDGNYDIIDDQNGNNSYFGSGFRASARMANLKPFNYIDSNNGRNVVSLKSVAGEGIFDCGNADDQLGIIRAHAGIQFPTGEVASRAGVAFMSSGAATVANTNVTVKSTVLLSIRTPGGTPGPVPYVTLNAGVGFTLTGAGTDSSIYNYIILDLF